MPKNTKRAGDGAWCVKSQPHLFAGTVPRPFDYAQGRQAQDDTLSRDNGGVSGPDYLNIRSVTVLQSDVLSAGNSWAHSAPAPVSGSQPLTRLSEPRFDAYSSQSWSFNFKLCV